VHSRVLFVGEEERSSGTEFFDLRSVTLRWSREAGPSKGDGPCHKVLDRSSFEARLRSHLRMTDHRDIDIVVVPLTA